MERWIYLELLEDRGRDRDNKSIWDARAGEFFGYSVEPVDSDAMKFIGSHIDLRDKSVIDIGCGTGRFLVPFVEMGAYVTGIDIAPQMLVNAEKTCRHYDLDRSRYNLAEFSWDGYCQAHPNSEFDLVFASMSPGISNWESIEKALIRAKEGLYIAGFAYRSESVIDRLSGSFPNLKKMDWTGRFRSMLSLLMMEGYYPDVKFIEKVRTAKYKPEEASYRLALRLTNGAADEEMVEHVEELMHEDAKTHGYINTVKRIVGMIYVDMNMRAK